MNLEFLMVQTSSYLSRISHLNAREGPGRPVARRSA